MDVPDEIIQRLAGVEKGKQAQEGIDICVEHIQELKEVEGWQASMSWPLNGRKGA